MQTILHLSLLSIVVFVIGVGTSIPTFDALGQNNAADL